jgi:hypothetical protein
MEPKAAVARSGDMQHGFPLRRELLDQRCSGLVSPTSPYGVVPDHGEGAQHSGSDQSWPPDTGTEQCAMEWFADRVGERQTALPQRAGLAVLLNDLNQPRREQNSAPTRGTLRACW